MEKQNERKLVNVFKKVRVDLVRVFESPKLEYERVGNKTNKEGKEESVYEYVPNPNKMEKEEIVELLYEQKLFESDLDEKQLALWVNRIK